MDTQQLEKQLSELKRILAKKKKKLQKCERRDAAKAHVKRTLQEQAKSVDNQGSKYEHEPVKPIKTSKVRFKYATPENEDLQQKEKCHDEGKSPIREYILSDSNEIETSIKCTHEQVQQKEKPSILNLDAAEDFCVQSRNPANEQGNYHKNTESKLLNDRTSKGPLVERKLSTSQDESRFKLQHMFKNKNHLGYSSDTEVVAAKSKIKKDCDLFFKKESSLCKIETRNVGVKATTTCENIKACDRGALSDAWNMEVTIMSSQKDIDQQDLAFIQYSEPMFSDEENVETKSECLEANPEHSEDTLENALSSDIKKIKCSPIVKTNLFEVKEKANTIPKGPTNEKSANKLEREEETVKRYKTVKQNVKHNLVDDSTGCNIHNSKLISKSLYTEDSNIKAQDVMVTLVSPVNSSDQKTKIKQSRARKSEKLDFSFLEDEGSDLYSQVKKRKRTQSLPYNMRMLTSQACLQSQIFSQDSDLKKYSIHSTESSGILSPSIFQNTATTSQNDKNIKTEVLELPKCSMGLSQSPEKECDDNNLQDCKLPETSVPKFTNYIKLHKKEEVHKTDVPVSDTLKVSSVLSEDPLKNKVPKRKRRILAQKGHSLNKINIPCVPEEASSQEEFELPLKDYGELVQLKLSEDPSQEDSEFYVLSQSLISPKSQRKSSVKKANVKSSRKRNTSQSKNIICEKSGAESVIAETKIDLSAPKVVPIITVSQSSDSMGPQRRTSTSAPRGRRRKKMKGRQKAQSKTNKYEESDSTLYSTQESGKTMEALENISRKSQGLFGNVVQKPCATDGDENRATCELQIEKPAAGSLFSKYRPLEFHDSIISMDTAADCTDGKEIILLVALKHEYHLYKVHEYGSVDKISSEQVTETESIIQVCLLTEQKDTFVVIIHTENEEDHHGLLKLDIFDKMKKTESIILDHWENCKEVLLEPGHGLSLLVSESTSDGTIITRYSLQSCDSLCESPVTSVHFNIPSELIHSLKLIQNLKEAVAGLSEQSLFIWNYNNGRLLLEISLAVSSRICSSIYHEEGILYLTVLQSHQSNWSLLAVNPSTKASCEVMIYSEDSHMEETGNCSTCVSTDTASCIDCYLCTLSDKNEKLQVYDQYSGLLVHSERYSIEAKQPKAIKSLYSKRGFTFIQDNRIMIYYERNFD